MQKLKIFIAGYAGWHEFVILNTGKTDLKKTPWLV